MNSIFELQKNLILYSDGKYIRITKMNEIKPVKKRKDKLEEIERRLRQCEHVSTQYQMLFEQLEAKMKALADRQGNIQAVYDYMVKVGSSIAKHNPNGTAFLLPNDDPRRIKDK